jgi:hypothetical protein
VARPARSEWPAGELPCRMDATEQRSVAGTPTKSPYYQPPRGGNSVPSFNMARYAS